jgi:hypothetical protein
MPRWSRSTSGHIPIHLRADNGAGSTSQRFVLHVVNVNDAPGPFSLQEPRDKTGITFLGADPEIRLRWQISTDPDDDTVRYTLQIDTTATFTSGARLDTTVLADSLHLALPRRNATYFWRVSAGDGTLLTPALSIPWSFSIAYVAPSFPRPDRDRAREPALEQNFPNPFNPSTSIKYMVQRAGYVRLAVYNLLGQEVAVLVDGSQPQGMHEVEFQKVDLPSGIYFYRLQAPGMFETKKMMIAK